PASLAATASATEPHCQITFIPAFFTCGTCSAGSPQKNVIAWIGSFSRVSTTPGVRNGTSRLTASGFFVILRALDISFWIASGLSPTSANVPSPPASETAPASSASDTPPIAAETIGYSIPNSSVIRVLNIAQTSSDSMFSPLKPEFSYMDPAPTLAGRKDRRSGASFASTTSMNALRFSDPEGAAVDEVIRADLGAQPLVRPPRRPACGELLILGKSVIRHTHVKTWSDLNSFANLDGLTNPLELPT